MKSCIWESQLTVPFTKLDGCRGSLARCRSAAITQTIRNPPALGALPKSRALNNNCPACCLAVCRDRSGRRQSRSNTVGGWNTIGDSGTHLLGLDGLGEGGLLGGVELGHVHAGRSFDVWSGVGEGEGWRKRWKQGEAAGYDAVPPPSVRPATKKTVVQWRHPTAGSRGSPGGGIGTHLTSQNCRARKQPPPGTSQLSAQVTSTPVRSTTTTHNAAIMPAAVSSAARRAKRVIESDSESPEEEMELDDGESTSRCLVHALPQSTVQ